ncbi:toxin-antitoxin system YwqK family antitoxin [Streptomyces bobili]|uniref:Uncharacterized protein n=1 Tax=Streptomyces bobili TaxID=67280 RepID=A0ABZ1QQF0_9ACTN|nr:hypothetical protein [Streptomyces bobili]
MRSTAPGAAGTPPATGAQHGTWRRWHATGNLLDEGTYTMGKKTGEWVTYSTEGKEQKRKNHR